MEYDITKLLNIPQIHQECANIQTRYLTRRVFDRNNTLSRKNLKGHLQKIKSLPKLKICTADCMQEMCMEISNHLGINIEHKQKRSNVTNELRINSMDRFNKSRLKKECLWADRLIFKAFKQDQNQMKTLDL